MTLPKYRMSMSLSILNQLGIKLYSAIPPVLSEIVANAWDADATSVDIQIEKDEIVITDNGHGMTIEDANEKYLFIGYERRKEKGGAITPCYKRKVMGRKGIGKLSLFSIANIIEVHTAKNGEIHGFRMNAEDIKKDIESRTEGKQYEPQPLSSEELRIKSRNGTIIVLREFKKKRFTLVAHALKKRIARRFSVIDTEHSFEVKINGAPVTIQDRDYFNKIQYMWFFGDESRKYVEYCNGKKIKDSWKRERDIIYTDEDNEGEQVLKVSGWIGTVENSGYLKDNEDNLNKVVIMVRGKLAQEDILEDFSEGGLFTKYLVGEIHADFLDLDDWEDAATSNRQEIIKEDPRYIRLKGWISRELKHIKNLWTDLRKEKGTDVALRIRAIKNWFSTLNSPTKKKAKSLFGKINQLTLNPEEKKQLFIHGVLAFENFRYKENLETLENISAENLKEFMRVFEEHNDIEATLYHQIVNERLQIINTLEAKVDENVLEKVLQEFLYENLWLLDASWDRATETPTMEKTVKNEFDKITATLSEDEAKARYDIKYKKTSGKHVIIELKRASVSIDTNALSFQVLKYKRALKKLLKGVNEAHENIEIICLLGKPPSDWADEEEKKQSVRSLAEREIRIVLYQELLNDAQKSYASFINKKKEAGRVTELIKQIELANLDETKN